MALVEYNYPSYVHNLEGANFFAPVNPIYPIPYVYAEGIFWKYFKVPVNILWVRLILQ